MGTKSDAYRPQLHMRSRRTIPGLTRQERDQLDDRLKGDLGIKAVPMRQERSDVLAMVYWVALVCGVPLDVGPREPVLF